ncbi:carboxypeptidase-like regulatory domain-containing protein [uncultured Gimesia sp.]|uniref:carboxypeptidase-like regulatory domain-containing protein n=1 Tax=uncultured Gimesia sp. TaxID=1678688 RepID=UPI0030D9D8C8|tara:strand:- start:52690 stop:53664 length:975 start_codon:yes stop_codon:yes gene_type:complete
MIRNWIHTLFSYLHLPLIAHADREMNDIREEIAFHLSSSAEENLDAGMDQQKSQQTALEQFGDVNSVVQDCCNVSLSRHVFWHRIHQILTLGLICAVGFLFWFYTRSKSANPDPAALAPSGYSLAETGGEIRGTIVTDRGEPVSAANVLAVVKTWPPNGFRQNSFTATTRADGTFLIKHAYPPEQDYEVQIAAIADGHLLQSEYISMRQGTLEPFRFQLKETAPFVLRFESHDGTPIAGVSAFPFKRIDQNGDQHCVYFCSAQPIVQKSNQTGTISMPHFLPGEHVTVYVRFPDSDWQARKLVIPKGKNELVLTPAANDELDDG